MSNLDVGAHSSHEQEWAACCTAAGFIRASLQFIRQVYFQASCLHIHVCFMPMCFGYF